MNKNLKRPELLLPAGSKEKLDYAIHYGADAVYLGMVDFSLRAMRKGELITKDNLADCIKLAHSMNKKVYLTLNIFAYDDDIKNMIETAEKIRPMVSQSVLSLLFLIPTLYHFVFLSMPPAHTPRASQTARSFLLSLFHPSQLHIPAGTPVQSGPSASFPPGERSRCC